MKGLLILSLHAQNDSSSQDFYNRTVAALDKKQASDHEVAQKLQDIRDAAKAQEPILLTDSQKPTAGSTEEGNPNEMEVPPYVKGKDNVNPTKGEGDDDARSVAGRKTRLKGGETKDQRSGKEAPIAVDREKEKYPAGKNVEKEEKVESTEVEMELNSILKKGPSTSGPYRRLTAGQDYNG